jgi:hypothetical protein
MEITLPPSTSKRQQSSAPASLPSQGRTPERRDVTLACRLSGASAVVAVFASAAGVFHPSIFRETAMTAGNARGTALVVLAIAVLTMVVSMILVARGSLRAQVVGLGALSYIAYNSVFFAYGAHFNSLFLLYAATLSLSVWSIVALLFSIDADGLRARFAPGPAVRVIAGYLLLSTALYALVWLKDIVPGIINNTAPHGLQGTGMVTTPVQMTDFSFAFPLTVLSAIWLWQRRAWGYPVAGAFLVYGVLEATSVATDPTFGRNRESTQSLAAVPMFVVLALVGLVPATVFLRHFHGESG